MKVLTFLRILFSSLVVLLFLKVLGWSLGLMNYASDLAVVAGVVGTLVSVFVPYLVIKNIWRRKS